MPRKPSPSLLKNRTIPFLVILNENLRMYEIIALAASHQMQNASGSYAGFSQLTNIYRLKFATRFICNVSFLSNSPPPLWNQRIRLRVMNPADIPQKTFLPSDLIRFCADAPDWTYNCAKQMHG
jgi:hypothetical protein